MQDNKVLKIVSVVVAVLFLVFLVVYGFTKESTSQKTPVQNTSTGLPVIGIDIPAGAFAHKNGKVYVEYPTPGTTVNNTFEVKGQAKGPWYFEASFPITVLNASGVVVGKGIAQAQGDWMTEGYVPFTVQMTLTQAPGTKNGILRLSKDDPSGENPDQLDVPIVFSAIN